MYPTRSVLLLRRQGLCPCPLEGGATNDCRGASTDPWMHRKVRPEQIITIRPSRIVRQDRCVHRRRQGDGRARVSTQLSCNQRVLVIRSTWFRSCLKLKMIWELPETLLVRMAHLRDPRHRWPKIVAQTLSPKVLLAFLSTDKPLANTLLHFDPAITPGSPIASSQAYDKGDKKGKRRASIQCFDAYLDSFDWSEIQENAFIQQTTVITDDHPNVPVLSRPPSACSHISLVSSAESFRSVMSFDIHVEAVETSESPGRSAHVLGLGPTPQRAVSPFSISGSAEDAIPDSPMRSQSQQCLDDEEDGTNALTTTRPPRTPSDDSRSFGILVDSTSPLRRAHSPQVDRQCLGQCTPEVCPALSRSPSPSVVPSTSTRSAIHPLTQSSHLSLIDMSAASPHRAWPLLSSLPPQPHIDPEVSVSPEVIGLGLSIEDAALPSSQRHALPHRTASQSSPRILTNLPAGSTAEQSPTRDDRSQLDAPKSQGQTPPSCSWAVAYDRAPSGGTRSMNGAAPSPRILPLPSSPSPPGSATSSTPTRLRAQPSHRLSPNHPFYPSLAGDDDDDTVTSDRQSILSTPRAPPPPQQHRPSPSGLHNTNLAFGLAALGLSPVIQVPTLIRSPLTDVQSPVHLDADTGCRHRRSHHHGHGFIAVACFFFSFFFFSFWLHSFIFASLGNPPRSWVHFF